MARQVALVSLIFATSFSFAFQGFEIFAEPVELTLSLDALAGHPLFRFD
jgi:hypothetical protein